jgi:heme exporter protein B
MISDARLIAVKDLRIEASSRILLTQVVPFGLMVLLLFGFGISPDRRVVEDPTRSVLEQVSPGLFWIAVLFAALLALGRSLSIESVDGNLDALRLGGLDPAGIFLGKAGAIVVQLLVLEFVLGAGAALLFGVSLANVGLLAITMVGATVAIACAGTLYGTLAAGQRVRETLVPLLVLPVLTPVLLGATQATEAALFGPVSDGWPWAGLVGAFALLYIAIGIVAFGSFLEES